MDTIKPPSKVIEGFVKTSWHSSYKALPKKHTNEGFDPNAYKLLVKEGYNPNEAYKLGKILHEVIENGNHGLNPPQRMMLERGILSSYFVKVWVIENHHLSESL